MSPNNTWLKKRIGQATSGLFSFGLIAVVVLNTAWVFSVKDSYGRYFNIRAECVTQDGFVVVRTEDVLADLSDMPYTSLARPGTINDLFGFTLTDLVEQDDGRFKATLWIWDTDSDEVFNVGMCQY